MPQDESIRSDEPAAGASTPEGEARASAEPPSGATQTPKRDEPRPAADTAPAPTPMRSADPPTIRSSTRSLAVGGAGGSSSGSGLGPGSGTGSSLGPNRGGFGGIVLPAPGQRVGTFELMEAIGSGGMGAVYKALDTRLHRVVALKILPPEQSNDPEVIQRFYREGQAAARLDHENIARVYTIDSDAGLHFIAFEYIEGTTIRQRVELSGPLTIAEAINYTLQIASALVHAAERGVVHRDIKPSNIIVTPQGRAKLVDMGLARRFERGGDHGLTQSGMTLGTFDYISPEQARDPRDVDVRSDLYSLGCTLFHMLTGRPPFPEGTVLQKLLQHQEDTPPDVRTLNPEVPPDLAAILVKLMAKDRDRRYQTPEQLVRDLLTLAGAHGLRSISPEGLIWMSATERPAWERHLIWGLPAAALVVVVAFLVWWGQPDPTALTYPADPGSELATSTGEAAKPAATKDTERATVKPATAEGTTANSSQASSNLAKTSAASTTREPEPPGLFEVAGGDDLAQVVAGAPSGSTIVLADNGPFDLSPSALESEAPIRLAGRDLTIRAAPGVRPVLRLARSGEGDDAPAVGALCQAAGGRLVLEGLEFLLDPGNRDEPLDAISAEDTDLTVRRCVFRRPTALGSSARVAALRVRNSRRPRPAGERPAPVVIDACHIGSGQVGLLAEGPVDVSVRDCTVAAASPAFWVDAGSNAGAEASPSLVPALHLTHSSILAGEGPVFRLVGGACRVRVDDCVVAPAREGEATLVACQDPDALDWLGRANLYAKVTTYLQTTRDAVARAPIHRFDAWADAPAGQREVDSLASNAYVWAESDPLQLASRDDPTKAFLLGDIQRPAAGVGIRRGPAGPLADDSDLIALAGPGADPAGGLDRATMPDPKPARAEKTQAPASTNAGRDAEANGASPGPMPVASPTDPAPMPVSTPAPMPPNNAAAPMTRPNENGELPAMPPMGRPETEPGPGTTSPAPMPVAPSAGSSSGNTGSTEERVRTTVAPTVGSTGIDNERSTGGGVAASAASPSSPANAQGSSSARSSATGTSSVRTAQQFRDAMRALGPRGGTVRVAQGASLVLPALEIGGPGRWVIEAEPAKGDGQASARPQLHFQPQSAGGEVRRNAGWPALFLVRSGSLQLRGIDVVLDDARIPESGRWAAFAAWAGAELTLENSTVTLEGRHPRSAVVAVVGSENELEAGLAPLDTSAASVRVNDSLLRSGGDLIDVTAGRRLDLELTNTLVATSGSLVHGHGLSRGQGPEPLKLDLRQVTARVAGGLVQLESTPAEPDLPLADIAARSCIFATNADGAPLLRVDGQDNPDDLRNRVRWEGHGVAYHQIGTYRRDQTAQIGTLPVRYDRSAWEVAVAPRDDLPLHGDLKFAEDWDPDRDLWTFTPDDAGLSADSPARASGPDLARIPQGPVGAGDE